MVYLPHTHGLVWSFEGTMQYWVRAVLARLVRDMNQVRSTSNMQAMDRELSQCNCNFRFFYRHCTSSIWLCSDSTSPRFHMEADKNHLVVLYTTCSYIYKLRTSCMSVCALWKWSGWGMGLHMWRAALCLLYFVLCVCDHKVDAIREQQLKQMQMGCSSCS